MKDSHETSAIAQLLYGYRSFTANFFCAVQQIVGNSGNIRTGPQTDG
jgi:hypothetical protein